jgi:RNA polymerase sigma factor (sigma-70 family)
MTDAEEALVELASGALRGPVGRAWSTFDRAWPALLRRLATAQRALGVRAELRDECGQAVLARVWKGRAGYRGGNAAELASWIHTICRREHVRLLESLARNPRPASDLADHDPDDDLRNTLPEAERTTGRAASPSSVAQRRDTLRALEDCIARLDADLREVVELLYSPDAPTERDVAAILGCSKSQVNVLRQRALRVLTGCMNRKGAGDGPE